MKPLQIIGRTLILACVLTALAGPVRTGYAWPISQENDPTAKASALFNLLSPAERVGQLFLVTFQGDQVDPDSPIYELITRFHVGGVVLMASNDNFSDEEQLIPTTYQMISALQQAGWDNSQVTPQAPADAVVEESGEYIPLFIAVSQEGDGYPNDQILSGLTTLPSQMAIGATWNTEISRQVGELLGTELSALGVNMLFGPSLDVHESMVDTGREGQGLGTFGGDPYWVQQIGSAYVTGIHQGSQGRIAVIAKHFPGLGSSDRSPDVEVATVRKTLEQLQQIELPPFFSVTGNAASQDATVDGVLVSHIRYLFQGNIRATTRPVSLDSSALQNLMSLPDLQTWQQSGGLLVSDDLGSRALRRFYDPGELEFDPRQVAREAFLAGNDLLYADDFTASNDPDLFTSLVNTLDFFTRKYNEDDAFAQRVNQSVLKILTRKFSMYPEFRLDQVIQPAENLDNVATNPDKKQLLFDVARSAVTLISPDISNLPDPPTNRDRIVFITDTGAQQQCSACLSANEIQVDALQSEVLRLYGPQTGGQVSQNRMSSYSFKDLLELLDETPPSGTPEPLAIQNDLGYANWLVISMQDSDPNRPESVALKRLLNERPDILRDKSVVVFAFDAPYFLDATDISKLSAYYALYSKTTSFIEMAARVLFQELTPAGSSPVSIPGIGYNLIEVTSPDPEQVIGLGLDTSPQTTIPIEGEASQTPTATLDLTGTPTIEPTEAPTFRKGDVIPLMAGPIVDHNGRPVPDGTLVRFIFTMDGGASGEQQIEAFTAGGLGLARTSYKIEREGLLDIRVASDEATRSFNLKLDISEGEGASVAVIQPTEMPTQTATPSPSPSPTPTITPTPTPEPPSAPGVTDWFLALGLTGLVAAGAYVGGSRWMTMRWGLRWGLCILLGGLVGYSYLAIGLPGGAALVRSAGTSGVVGLTLVGMLLGGAAGIGWWRWLEFNPSRKP